VEIVEPGFDENLQTVMARTERYITESVTAEGTSQAVRDAHAKGYGLVRGEVEILGGLPEEYAQGIYATLGRHDALVRFSNGSPHAGADARLGRAVGLALKMFDIDGPSLKDPNIKDFVTEHQATACSYYRAISDATLKGSPWSPGQPSGAPDEVRLGRATRQHVLRLPAHIITCRVAPQGVDCVGLARHLA